MKSVKFSKVSWNRSEWSACFHGTFSLWCRQWRIQDGNLRNRDLVKTSRPRLHQKSRDFKICAFYRNFLMLSSLLS